MSNNKRKNFFFLRYGGLSPMKQEHYETNQAEKTFHNPPVKYGFYAVPEYAIEMFLISGMLLPSRNRAKWLKNPDGTKAVLLNDDYSFEGKRGNAIYSSRIKTIAKKNNVRLKHISSQYIETDDEDRDYQANMSAAFSPRRFKYTDNLWHHLDVPRNLILRESGSWVLTTYKDYVDAYYKEMSSENYSKRLNGYYHSKDHFEVFIPKLQKYKT